LGDFTHWDGEDDGFKPYKEMSFDLSLTTEQLNLNGSCRIRMETYFQGVLLLHPYFLYREP